MVSCSGIASIRAVAWEVCPPTDAAQVAKSDSASSEPPSLMEHLTGLELRVSELTVVDLARIRALPPHRNPAQLDRQHTCRLFVMTNTRPRRRKQTPVAVATRHFGQAPGHGTSVAPPHLHAIQAVRLEG